MHYKSTIASSNENRTFIDNLTLSNTTCFPHNPVSHSSILENSEFKIPIENVSNYNKNNDIILLDDNSPKPSKVNFPKQIHPTLIDLTENEYSEKSPESSKSNLSDKSNRQTTSECEYLQMEKRKLDEIIMQYTKNINNLKVSKGKIFSKSFYYLIKFIF